MAWCVPQAVGPANMGMLGDGEKRGVLGWTDGLLRAMRHGPVGQAELVMCAWRHLTRPLGVSEGLGGEGQ